MLSICKLDTEVINLMFDAGSNEYFSFHFGLFPRKYVSASVYFEIKLCLKIYSM